jgi:hypothetical protein
MPVKKSPARKKTKAKKDNPANVIELIEVAQVLGATSGFLVDGLFSPEALENIVRSRFKSIEQEKIASLIDVTSAAVTQLDWDCRQPNKKAIAAKYSAIVESAVRFAEDLSTVLRDSSLEGPFLDLLVPRPSSPEQIERLARIRHHMVGDLLWFQAVMGPKIQMIRDNERTRKDFEYKCAFQIAFAWLEATGEVPTLTRNTDAVSGPQSTAFQRYMIEAVKSGIGEAVIRKAVTELGQIVAQSSLSEIPKGFAGA